MDWIGPNIIIYGPWLVGLMAMMETALIVGLVLPTEPTLILATTLAMQGHVPMRSIVAAAIIGALLGDSVGFAIGRWGLPSGKGGGKLSRLAAQQRLRVAELFEKHSGYSIVVARLIPFARTVSPLFAGSTSLSYRRFLLFDFLGVAVWAVVAFAIAYTTARGWQMGTDSLGTEWTAVLAILILIGVFVYKRFTRRSYRIPESISVALTGNIGSGKSTVAKFLVEEGVPFVSADELARQAVKPGSSGLREVIDVFGESVLDSDGSLNRKALGSLVFKDKDARKRLESIIHPRIRILRDRWMKEHQFDISPISVSEVPLLFEADLQDGFDLSIVVSAPENTRILRLQEERNLAPEDSRQIMANQIESGLKEELADYTIQNDLGLVELRSESLDVLRRVTKSAKNLKGLQSSRLKIDMHMHSRDSFDCRSDPAELLKEAKRKGIGRIAITDHNRLGISLEMAKDFPEEIIPGEEVKTSEGVDLIGLYLSEEIPKGTSLRKTCSIIKEQGGISYLPHPYARGKGGSGRYAKEMGKLVDIVEVFNSRLHPVTLNSLAEELADSCSKLRGAGSDAHTVGEVGRAYVEVERHSNDPKSLLAALEFSQVRGVESSRIVHLASTWAKIRK